MKPIALLLTLIAAIAPGAVVAANSAPASFAYVLQADAKLKPRSRAVRALRECGRDWLILDAAYDGSARWTRRELDYIRAGKSGRRIVCYLSIGEAETYRPYWSRAWDLNRDGRPDPGAPDWLVAENPDWEGNYKVRYWMPAWQNLILPEVDRIMEQGFDGLYLDIVDAFEFFERDGDKHIDHRTNPATGNTYREDMARWVRTIAQRATRSRLDALVIPQNGAQLLALPDYRQTIAGIGVEDLYNNGRKPHPASETRYTLDFLKRLKPAGKPVLVIDYAKKKSLRESARQQARQHGFVFLNTDRALKTLGVSP